MVHFFPAASRLDTERAPSLNRRAHSRNTLREAANDSPSDSHSTRPSHINWLQQNSMAQATTTQAGPSTPRRPRSVRLSRSASLSAIPAPPPALRRQSSLISSHSLQLATSSRTGTNPAAAPVHPAVKQLSPISERSYVPTPRQEHLMDVEPTTPVSISEPRQCSCVPVQCDSTFLLFSHRFDVFCLLTTSIETVDLRSVNELPPHKRNAHPSPG